MKREIKTKKQLTKAIKKFIKECADEKTFPKNSRGENLFSAMFPGFSQFFDEELLKIDGELK